MALVCCADAVCMLHEALLLCMPCFVCLQSCAVICLSSRHRTHEGKVKHGSANHIWAAACVCVNHKTPTPPYVHTNPFTNHSEKSDRVLRLFQTAAANVRPADQPQWEKSQRTVHVGLKDCYNKAWESIESVLLYEALKLSLKCLNAVALDAFILM